MAEEVCQHHHLSKILFIPTYTPPHKQVNDLADTHHRYEMIKAAISGESDFEVSDIEIMRKGKSYTIDTVREILEQYGNESEIFLIMGADSLNELELWKNIKKLSQLCHFVVVNRPGFNTEVSARLVEIIGNDNISDMERLRIEMDPVGVSSTEIRKRVNDEVGINGLVPECVEAYIRDHALYTHI
ncbi:nicotinic acid mononucleotide adenylyltransferase [Candidatus Scalindua japonica]|uniref:Probable nicotinate-nucleotide adenylyltransferase n=2 Tax=Candidatus Scalindua japonica TaxID=1284222 RepID=A0A286TXX2_9BACT|nr:nicotinic acid mononucleotide adenylyltransferase [Candidatus Scalindua japonica]